MPLSRRLWPSAKAACRTPCSFRTLPGTPRLQSHSSLKRRAFQTIEQFQFEMLRISNHTACRFAEKARFFRSLWAGRLGRAALCRRLAFHLFSKLKRSRACRFEEKTRFSALPGGRAVRVSKVKRSGSGGSAHRESPGTGCSRESQARELSKKTGERHSPADTSAACGDVRMIRRKIPFPQNVKRGPEAPSDLHREN